MEKPLILIVDDTPQNIELLSGILKADYKIRAARSGMKALEIAKLTPKPDLILLDIMMPEMDGYEVCRRLKADALTSHIPIIFVTAKISAEDEIRGLDLGAADYLTKPVTPEIARQRIKTHLALYQQNREFYWQVKQQTDDINQGKKDLLSALSKAGEFKDNETGYHVVRVGEYCHEIALALGMTEQHADLLREAAPMHDIGKIGTPDAILLKPGKLEPDEWEEMKRHVDYGVQIMSASTGDLPLFEMAKSVISSHHEKWNGTGYPAGLAGEDIPFEGRIVAIADVFDALTSERPYKEPWPLEKTVNLIKQESGHQFDPKVVDAFLSVLDRICDIKERYRD